MSFSIALLLIAQAVASTAPPAPPATTEQGPTKAEMDAQVKDYFVKLDTNRDGRVDRAEAEAAYEASLAAERAAAFARLDTNKDGMLSQNEFAAVTPRSAKSRWLDANDIDKNGHVELNEALARGQRTFERIDANNDGIISAQEMQSLRQRGRPR